ncbi:MAG TPA: DUF4214 domain-containing protein [Iamia sp.]
MRLRTRLLTSAAVVGTLVAPLVPGAPAGAAPTEAIDDAVAWLETQQQADGGFDTAGFAGFETPDAIFALAAAGQADGTWSTAEALSAVEAVTTGGETPEDALDGVDAWVDDVQNDGEASAAAKAQQAAKVIVLVTAPLGLDATDFDPSANSASDVDLVAALQAGAGPNLDYPGVPLAQKVYVIWALAALAAPVPNALRTAVIETQQANGGFNFDGDPTLHGFDPDVTAAAVIALTEAGLPANAEVIERALTGLGFQQRWDGEWAGPFDDGNPNSTALVMLAGAALGADPATSCWRDRNEPGLVGVPFPSPEQAILRAQDDDGHMTSPSDVFGTNTFATSQSIQGLMAAEGVAFYRSLTSCTVAPISDDLRLAQSMYVDLLLRVSEPGGAPYWATQFANGLSPALLAKRFTGTPEYGRRVVTRLSLAYLERPATPTEQSAGAPTVVAGRRFDLAATILGSEEYYTLTKPSFPPDAEPTPESWGAAVFPAALGRPTGPDDQDFIDAQLEAGRTRAQIARKLLLSQEGRNHAVRQMYEQLLRRQPLAADLQYWAGELGRGVSPERLVTLIIGSAEYRSLTEAPV